jgi:hypothetical protein
MVLVEFQEPLIEVRVIVDVLYLPRAIFINNDAALIDIL